MIIGQSSMFALCLTRDGLIVGADRKAKFTDLNTGYETLSNIENRIFYEPISGVAFCVTGIGEIFLKNSYKDRPDFQVQKIVHDFLSKQKRQLGVIEIIDLVPILKKKLAPFNFSNYMGSNLFSVGLFSTTASPKHPIMAPVISASVSKNGGVRVFDHGYPLPLNHIFGIDCYGSPFKDLETFSTEEIKRIMPKGFSRLLTKTFGEITAIEGALAVQAVIQNAQKLAEAKPSGIPLISEGSPQIVLLQSYQRFIEMEPIIDNISLQHLEKLVVA